MEEDALDLAVARYARQTGLITAEQLSRALQAKSDEAARGAPSSLADVLLKLGFITSAQREMVEEKAKGRQDAVRQLLHFKLLRKLGEGGMGAVYLAEDTKLGKTCALKVLSRHLSNSPDFVKRFRREAEASARLDHPNLVRAYERGEDLGFHFYAMEYCEGAALDQVLVAERMLPVERAIAITLDAARGLQYAHAQGIIHRDIKPGNIFLVKDGPAKVLDLGLSKTLEGGASSFQTVTGTVLGTPHYISPEQAEGDKGVDGRSDLYSLGATLYHMLTGDAPFPGSSNIEIMYKHVHEQLPDPRDLREDIPEGLVLVLNRMMAKAAKDRHPDGAALIADLEEVRGGRAPKSDLLPPERTSIAARGRLGRGAPRRPATIRRMSSTRRARAASSMSWIAAGAAALLVGLLAFVASQKSSTPAPIHEPPRAVAATPVETPPPVRPPDPPARPPPPVRPPDAAVPVVPPKEDPVKPPPPPPAAFAPRTVELLPLVVVGLDSAHGRWDRRGGAVVSDTADDALLQLPYRPPEEYDFILEFSRQNARCGTGPLAVHGGGPFGWVMGAYENRGAGFADIGGQGVEKKDAGVPPYRLEDGRRYVSELRVRRRSVIALIDGKEVDRWTPDRGALTVNSKLVLPDRTALGVVSCETVTTLTRISVVEVSGPGTPLRAAPRPVDDPWLKSVAALAPEAQVKAVIQKLREHNPEYDGKHAAGIEGGQVVSFEFKTIKVWDVSPVRALASLKKLGCDGMWDDVRKELSNGLLESLEGLRGLKLESLNCGLNPIRDLSPLSEMPLYNLDFRGTQVADLRPISRLPLRAIDMGATPVTDFSPLRALKLTHLSAWETALEDLSVLTGMPLEALNVSKSRVKSLALLRGKSLCYLDFEGCSIGDLSPLKDSTTIRLLVGPFRPVRDAALLRSMKLLEKVNDVPVKEFLLRKDPPPDARPWRKLFDGNSLDFLSRKGEGAWMVEGGALVRKAEGRAAAQTDEEFEDGEFRVRFEQKGSEYVSFTLRQSEAGSLSVNLPKGPLSSLQGKIVELGVTCRGGQITARIDGRDAAVEKNGTPARRGHVQFNAVGGTFRVLSLEFRPLP